MIPDFLHKIKSLLEKRKLETVRIKASPIEQGEKISITQSKFLGRPFLPLNQEYPKDKFGNPMILLAQINFEEVPPIKGYPISGILQIFTSIPFWHLGNEYFLYLYHENKKQPYHENFPDFSKDDYNEFPISSEHKLTFLKESDYGGLTDIRTSNDDNKRLLEFCETLPEQEQNKLQKLLRSDGHKIGGYAYFTQQDLRAFQSDKKNHLLLLQIDTDKKIMFGDAGISNIFISEVDLVNRAFDKAYFNWDCA